MVGLTWCAASAASSLTSRSFHNASGHSARDRIGPTGHLPHLFRIVLVLAEQQRTSGLLVQVSLNACKTLQSIRCSTASFDRIHTSENDDGLIRILS